MRTPITITDTAKTRIKQLMSSDAAKDALGLRIGVESKGCSGMAYTINFADSIGQLDDVVEADGTKVIIDPSATMFILGTEMDYVETDLKSGFEFKNPNEAGRCGCGESFFIERPEQSN